MKVIYYYKTIENKLFYFWQNLQTNNYALNLSQYLHFKFRFT